MSVVYCNNIYWPNFLSIGKHGHKYSHGIYRGNRSRKKRNKKRQTIRWRVSCTYDVTDKIISMVKFIHEYLNEKLSSIYTNDITEVITKDSRRKIIRWHDISTNRVTIRIIMSVIFNLWPDARLSSPLPHFYFFLVHFFYNKQPPLPPSISTQLNFP